MIDDDALRVSTTVKKDGVVSVAVHGYLDDAGGRTLAREILGGLPAEESPINIDLDAVTLFNCSGARRLLATVDDLHHQGHDVDLVGVRPSLQRLLDFAA